MNRRFIYLHIVRWRTGGAHLLHRCHVASDLLLCGVQGALYGVRSVAQGFGPILFSSLFQYYTRPSHYFPSAPLVACAALMAAGVAVAATMHVPPRPDHHGHFAAARHSPLDDDPELGELLDGAARSHAHGDAATPPGKRGESLELLGRGARFASPGIGKAVDAAGRQHSMERARSAAASFAMRAAKGA